MSALRTVRRAFSEAPVRRSVLRILRENVLCSLSSVSPGNRAHVNTAYFCYSPDLELFFLSDPRSRHVRNLKVNPSAAIAVSRPRSRRWVFAGAGIAASVVAAGGLWLLLGPSSVDRALRDLQPATAVQRFTDGRLSVVYPWRPAPPVERLAPARGLPHDHGVLPRAVRRAAGL